MLNIDVGKYAGRLDAFLKEQQDTSQAKPLWFTSLSKSGLADAIAAGRVAVQDRPTGPFTTITKKAHRLKAKGIVRILPPPAIEPQIESSRKGKGGRELQILYEDDDLCVVNKPAGICVHGDVGKNPEISDTVVAAMLRKYGRQGLSQGEGPERPGIVHRLDKETSGVLVVCRNDITHAKMKQSFARDSGEGKNSNATSSIAKWYTCVVHGTLTAQNKYIDIQKPLKRHPTQGHKVVVGQPGDGKSKPSHSVAWPQAVYAVNQTASTNPQRNNKNKQHKKPECYTLVRVQIFTGRTHQIRVHMQSLGHPIVGDGLYGGARKRKPQNEKDVELSEDEDKDDEHKRSDREPLLLCASEIRFQHPTRKQKSDGKDNRSEEEIAEEVHVTVSLPDSFTTFLTPLSKQLSESKLS